MKFLTEREIEKEISRQLAAGSSLKAAVAFWGRGATQKLRIGTYSDQIKIVCNLRSGGTNPAEIETLKKIKTAVVKHRDDLHAKVYLFDNAAIIGSSNASANGLAFQDGDGLSWREANILVHDASLLNEISDWFDKIFRQAKAVTPEDIKIALEAWKTKRSGNNLQSLTPNRTLLKAARENPHQFDGRKIYISLGNEEASKAAAKTYQEYKKKITQVASKGISFYENWRSIPEDAVIIDFWNGGDDGISLQGIYQTPPQRISIPVKNTSTKNSSIQICYECKKVNGLPLGSHKAWERAALRARNEKERFLPLSDFAARYLSQIP